MLADVEKDNLQHRVLGLLVELLPRGGATQERVAEELGLPFNTYRYHLARGTDRVVEALWQRELQPVPPSPGTADPGRAS